MAPTARVVSEPDATYAKRLVEVVPERFAKGVDLAKRENCDGLRVVPDSTSMRRSIELPLDLLAEVPHLKMLSISPYVMMAKKQKVDGLYALRSLKSLSFHHRAYTFSPNAMGFDGLVNLESLDLWSLNTDDCRILEGMRNLEELHIFPSQLRSLKRLRALPKLRMLKVSKCPRLDTLEELAHVRTLRKLWIEACKNLTDIEPLVGHPSLESLILDTVDTLAFVPRIKNLKELYFKELKDGDLSPVLKAPNLKSARFLDKKHYSHKRSEIDALIKARFR
jgi:hypothetical protein